MLVLRNVAGYTPARDLGWEGRDVWPMLVGRAPAAGRTLYWRGRRGWEGPADRVALGHENWKLLARLEGRSLVECELFDLAADPYETGDLAPASPERVAALRKLLEAQIALDDPDALRSRS